ncbi:MAG TPA: preprotein translocase subunit YajC [Acidimicrobiales bacterium]|nr:preprotein translocase subunit YajC [Acidimicrobiales bacterium]
MDLIILPLLFLIMYLLLIRPQQQRVKRQRQLVAELQVGDEVVTAGGIVGTIRVLDEAELRLEVGSGVEVRVLRGAVSRKLGPGAAEGGMPGPDA